MDANPFDALAGHRYLRLSTFRRSGEPVPTPVWFARVGDVLYVVTGWSTGKAKRIRNNPEVTLAPSDFMGRPKGPSIEATARLTDQQEDDPAGRALRKKYGWLYRIALGIEQRLAARYDPVFLELRPADAVRNVRS